MHLRFSVVVVTMIAWLVEERTVLAMTEVFLVSYAWYAVNFVKAQPHTYDTYLSITYLPRTGLDILPFRSSRHLCIYYRLTISIAVLWNEVENRYLIGKRGISGGTPGYE